MPRPQHTLLAHKETFAFFYTSVVCTTTMMTMINFDDFMMIGTQALWPLLESAFSKAPVRNRHHNWSLLPPVCFGCVGFVPFLHHFAVLRFSIGLSSNSNSNCNCIRWPTQFSFCSQKGVLRLLAIWRAAFRAQFVILMISMESSHIIEPGSSSGNFCFCFGFWESQQCVYPCKYLTNDRTNTGKHKYKLLWHNPPAQLC